MQHVSGVLLEQNCERLLAQCILWGVASCQLKGHKGRTEPRAGVVSALSKCGSPTFNRQEICTLEVLPIPSAVPARSLRFLAGRRKWPWPGNRNPASLGLKLSQAPPWSAHCRIPDAWLARVCPTSKGLSYSIAHCCCKSFNQGRRPGQKQQHLSDSALASSCSKCAKGLQALCHRPIRGFFWCCLHRHTAPSSTRIPSKSLKEKLKERLENCGSNFPRSLES